MVSPDTTANRIAWDAQQSDPDQPIVHRLRNATGQVVFQVEQDGTITTLLGTNPVATGQTTDAAPLDLWTFALADNTVYTVRAVVAARRTNAAGRGLYVREFTAFREAGGPATLGSANIGIPTPDVESDAAWDVDAVVAGNNLILRVTGAVGHTVRWNAALSIVRTST